MADIESLLEKRSSVLAPTQAQRDAAARSHGYLREILMTGNMESRIQNSYLSGSYARHTAIRPLDDVDVIFEIDPNQWRRDAFRTLFSMLPSPDMVLETFARAIRLRYPSSTARTQRRSIGLVMDHLHIDVVPAVVHDRNASWLYVPDRTDATWISSAPAIHEAVTTNVNKACGDRFKPLVRLLKGWNGSIPSTACIRSFAIESLAARVLQNLPQTSLFGGMIAFFDFVAWRGGHPTAVGWRDAFGVDLKGWSGGVLPDIGGTGANILAGIETDRLVRFIESARIMRDELLATQKSRDAATAWAKIDHRLRGGLERV